MRKKDSRSLLSLCRVPSFENRVTLPATKSLKRERERLFRCPNRRESRPLPTCTRRREGQGPLFFLSLLSCCYEYMEENGEPFLRIDLVGSETGTPFPDKSPLAGTRRIVINPVASLTSSYNSQRLHRFFRAA